MCLAQGPQRNDAGEAGTCGLSVSSEAIYHWATALHYKICVNAIFLIKLLQNYLPTGFLDLLITNRLYRHDNLNNMGLNATKSVFADSSWQSWIQTSLLSCRDWLENWNFACSKFRYDTSKNANKNRHWSVCALCFANPEDSFLT